MKVSVVCVLLLLAVVCVGVHSEMKMVKLCGREFVRAVIYTCGGSRWRRIPGGGDLPGNYTKYCCFICPGQMPLNPFSRSLNSLEDISSEDSREIFSSSNPLVKREAPLKLERDLNQIITTGCCQFGCNKKDLSFLC
uniref:Insulin-like 5a n=1 Tax=Erpetoichthys calabaricus TaxID=27687 RepID=A0A8C4SB40_ERPCA